MRAFSVYWLSPLPPYLLGPKEGLRLKLETESPGGTGRIHLGGFDEDKYGGFGVPPPRPSEEIGPASIPAVREALKDNDWKVRRPAALALGNIGPAALPTVIGLLKDKDQAMRQIGVETLGRMGPAAIPALTELLKDKDQWIRDTAISALGETRSGGHPNDHGVAQRQGRS